MKMSSPQVGSSAPLGAAVRPDGVNFSVFSRHATAIELLLFDDAEAVQPSRIVQLDSGANRTYHYWHVFVPDLRPGQIYAYRVHGPFAPERGLRFDPAKVLLDPYGRGIVVPDTYDRQAASRAGDTIASAMKSVVADPSRYDWEGDRPLQMPFAETLVYEMHVGGFTKHPSSGVAPGKRGTYAGLIEKVPYLRDLGITAVELLPVHQFDPQSAPNGVNYWGYQPVSFFAPHHGYSSTRDPLGAIDEFRDMVKALHRAGIEVILDVVFNHTGEGGADGPTLCYRGFANEAYYTLQADRSQFADYTGCGNTLNANHTVVRRMILDSLRYWVAEMHVDGFRFDLASILTRDEDGQPVPNPPVLWDIESDPALAGTKLIAEAWDAAGLYQVGSFIGDTWQEWNGRFRDDVRRFWRGDNGAVRQFGIRFLGSPDMYGHENREAEQSINFVTCHDGFTLNDLVSYNQKHNAANGEDNRDGSDDNMSWNCGVEGPSDDPDVEALRNRQVKNLLASLLLSTGTPMLLMGDEVRRTQQGNNNAYCQDNDISWFDWSLLERHGDIRRFVKALAEFRRRRDVVDQSRPITLNDLLHRASIEWHGVELGRPDCGDNSHSLALAVGSLQSRFLFHSMMNAYWEPLAFELPSTEAGIPLSWRKCVDTAAASGDDVHPWDSAPPVPNGRYVVPARTFVLLAARLSPDAPIERVGVSDA